MAGLHKTKRMLRLADMQPNMSSFSTIALIISKSEPNTFLDKRSNEHRGVITFTLRDSKRHIVNCKCWGSKEIVDGYNMQLHMGDVVDVVRAKVMPLCQPNGNERYQPRPTLSCALVVNEGQGQLQLHNGNDVTRIEELWSLRNLSHKPPCTALTLADVRNGAGAQRAAVAPQYIDLFVAVASMKPVKELKRKKTRDGEPNILRCLELVVLDASCPDGMVFTIWHYDWIRRAVRFWHSCKTVLHLIDVSICFSEFHGRPALRHTAGTLIYENPQGVETQQLLAYAATVPMQNFDIFAQVEPENLPSANQIQTQMTVKQIYSRAEGDLRDMATQEFTAVLYAMVTKFDIDGQTSTMSKKCKSCQRLIPQNKSDCDNEMCQLEFSLNFSGPKQEHFFNINMQLTDQTGTLLETRLSGGVAEHLLGLSAGAFTQQTERQKTELKWRFLLKYFEVKLMIKKPSVLCKNLAIIVVDMKPIELHQLMQKISVF